MTDGVESWRDELVANGWQQGSLLPVDAGLEILAWAAPEKQGVKQARKTVERVERETKGKPDSPVHFERVLREGDRLCVMTQTCDLIKQPDHFPLVDLGLVYSTAKEAILAEADSYGSSRRYRLTPRDQAPPALVLDFGLRTQCDKGVLLADPPDNSVVDAWSLDDRHRFARWLGRRYARPVITDTDTAEIHSPVRAAWAAATEAGEIPDLAAWCNEFAEVRFTRIDQGKVQLFLLSPSQEVDAVLGAEYLDWLSEALEARGQLSVTGVVTSYHEFTIAQREGTQELDLEWASDDEGKLSGPLPSDP